MVGRRSFPSGMAQRGRGKLLVSGKVNVVQKQGETLHPLKLTKGSFTFENRPKIAKGNSNLPTISGRVFFLEVFSLQKTFHFILPRTYRYMSLSSL